VSDLGFLERLLDGAAVEWVPLGEVCVVKTGPNINKALIAQSPGPYPVINSGRDPLGYFNDWNTENEPIGITSRGAGVGYVMWTNGRFFRGNLNYSCAPKKTSSLNTRFLYHFLLFSELEIQSLATYQGIPALNASALKTLPIPIPCPEDPQKSLAIQAEIVRILDAFTALTAELTAELTARKTQYNHYRDQLLSFEDGEVEWKTLGDVVATIKTGKLNANAMVGDGKYPFFTCDASPFKIDTYAFDTEAIIVSGNGSQVGHINYYNGKFNAYQRTYILADCPESITMGFLLTYLTAYLRPYIMQHAKKGSVPYITMPMLQNFKIPVPSLAEQARIVAILEKFETLTTSLSEGLPREIALRQRQYEHYRNLLLDFSKSANRAEA
jgi:type I restriction enzyme S subunit